MYSIKIVDSNFKLYRGKRGTVDRPHLNLLISNSFSSYEDSLKKAAWQWLYTAKTIFWKS